MDPITMMAIAKTAGTVFGAIQSAQGASKSKQADRMSPDIIDPNRVRDLEEAKRRQNSLAAGTDTTTQQALKQAGQNTRATQRDIAKSTGGNVAGTVSGLLQSQSLGGSIENQALASAGERGMAMGNLYNKITEDISQRKLDIQQFRSVQKRAEGARLKKEGSANVMAGLSSLLGSQLGQQPPKNEGDSSSDSKGTSSNSIFDTLNNLQGQANTASLGAGAPAPGIGSDLGTAGLGIGG